MQSDESKPIYTFIRHMAWIPTHITWNSGAPRTSDLEIQFTIQVDPEDLTAPFGGRVPCFVEKLFFTYKTVDAPQDLFKRMDQLTIRQGGRVVHQCSAHAWSTALVLQDRNFFKDRKESRLYIPLLADGVCLDVRHAPVEVSISFRHYQQEHERARLFAQFTSTPPPAITRGGWTITKPIYVKMPTDPEVVDMDIPLPWSEEGQQLAQIVFHIPGANHWIKSGTLCRVFPDEPTRSEHILYRFDDPYEPVVIDKLLFKMPLPKSSLFTLTFRNWHAECPRDQPAFVADSPGQLVLRLKLDALSGNDRPNEANLEIFAVTSLPHLTEETATATA